MRNSHCERQRSNPDILKLTPENWIATAHIYSPRDDIVSLRAIAKQSRAKAIIYLTSNSSVLWISPLKKNKKPLWQRIFYIKRGNFIYSNNLFQEKFSMQRTKSDFFYCLIVSFCPISFVFCKTICREFSIQIWHNMISRYFCEDRSHRNLHQFSIAINNCLSFDS